MSLIVGFYLNIFWHQLDQFELHPLTQMYFIIKLLESEKYKCIYFLQVMCNLEIWLWIAAKIFQISK